MYLEIKINNSRNTHRLKVNSLNGEDVINLLELTKIIQDEIINHPLFLDTREEEEKNNSASSITMRVVALSDFSIIIRAYVWAGSNDDAFILQCDVFESVKKRFDKEGIEIPFPYRTVVFKNDIEKSKEI